MHDAVWVSFGEGSGDLLDYFEGARNSDTFQS